MKRARETGAALLSVLLLVALMAGLIAVSFDRIGLALRVAANRDAARTARWDMISAEQIARDRIGAIGADETQRRAQRWAGRSLIIAVPHGTLTATLNDAGNCFNLNALVRRDAQGQLIANPQSAAQLLRLLIAVGETPQDAALLVAATSDWLDSDSVEAPGGAEAPTYARQSPVLLPANSLIDDPSEWIAVRGVNPARLARLVPLVCTLPLAEPVPLNINSLTPDQAALLASLFSNAPAAEVLARVIAERPAGGWRDATALLAVPALRGALLADGAVLGLRSQWFRLDLDAQRADATFHGTALFDARIEPVRMVRRSFGEP